MMRDSHSRSPKRSRSRERRRPRERESERSSGYREPFRGYDRDGYDRLGRHDGSTSRASSSKVGKWAEDDERRRGDNLDRSRRYRDDGRGDLGRDEQRRRRVQDEHRTRPDGSPRREQRRERGDERYGGRNPSRSRSPRRRSSHGTSSRPRSKSKSPSAEDKAKPNFKPSGLLAAATNTVQLSDGTKTVLKYNEPPEARKPQVGWRLYVFKGTEQTDVLHIHRQSAYLVGRDKTVVDIFVEHPSCSKQHAAIQFRQVQEKDELGSSKPVVKPFIIDLESTNGTLVNDEAIPTARYFELRASDVIKFGQSTREYVLLHDEV